LGLWAEEWAANEVTPSILAKGKEEEEEVLKKEESRSIGIYIFFSSLAGVSDPRTCAVHSRISVAIVAH
jgi:hypothetical protein